MKYICIDDGALIELTASRSYQSVEFENGNSLIQALSGKDKFHLDSKNFSAYEHNEGVFIATPGSWKKKKFLVIDCDTSRIFGQLKAAESLQSFQKLMRFCIKYWSNGLLNKSEKIVGSKAVIFPLSFSTRPYRIVIEREPMNDRLKKRDMSGQFLLVYKDCYEGASSTDEIVDATNFKKAFENLASVYERVNEPRLTDNFIANEAELVRSTSLSGDLSSKRSIHTPYSDWLPQLTTHQRVFVEAPVGKPHRLHGPAGTGKTLSLLLRTIRILQEADKELKNFNALLVTHSEATKRSIKDILQVMDPNDFQGRDRNKDKVSLSLETLASLCASTLSQSISETEFVDRDAQDSKILQKMYIEEAVKRARSKDFPSFRPFVSDDFRKFMEETSDEDLSPLFQHEISVLIKGRAGDSYEKYKECPRLKYGLPIYNEDDKGFTFQVFRYYQEQLETASQFDTDDVVISAVGQLDTPIWRRRRVREGYDFIAIDETHLFNMNELHVFHHFTREVTSLPISFTVDQAQSVGDCGWNDIDSVSKLFDSEVSDAEETTAVSTVFRSSPQIRDFCQSVLASGVTLFTQHFDNTLRLSTSAFTNEEERRSQPVNYVDFVSDATLIKGAFDRAEALRSITKSSRSQVLITTMDDKLLDSLNRYVSEHNKPISYLERRGDFIKQEQAEKSGHMVLGHADFVGGLEFDVVIIIGVDKGRVPHEGETVNSNSKSFSSYAAYNRLYVAASRARFALEILGVQSRGPSELLTLAMENGLISRTE